MTKWKRRLANVSLKYKIAAMTLVVAVVPLFIFATTLVVAYNGAIEKRSTKHIEENIRIMSERIYTVFKEGNLCLNYLLLNLNTIYNDTGKKAFQRDNLVRSQINETLLIFDGIDSIVYLDRDGKLYATDITLQQRSKEIQASGYLEQLKHASGKSILFDQKEPCMVTDDEGATITMGKRVTNIISGETIGYLFLNINESQLEKSVKYELSSYILLNGQGENVAGATEDSLLQKLRFNEFLPSEDSTMSIRYEGRNYIVAKRTIKTYQWTIIGITNLEVFNVSKEELMMLFLVTGSITLVLLISSTIFLSRRVTKPLEKLKGGAKEIADGNLDTKFAFSSQDEIGLLGQIFNHMTEQIKELIHRVDEEARKKREYELALVQEQIKPHFLYNTLDIILILIEMGRNREAGHVTKKLASFYKNSLSGSEEIISLEKEIHMTEDYLELQRIRYQEKFTYSIEMEQGMEQISLPKLTLQPLVENAIYHGLKCKEGSGTIRIVGRRLGDCCEIAVEDDGVGMKEEQLALLMRMNQKQRGHFGVYSVDHRLKLYYGEMYGLQVKSKEGAGTTIIVQIPMSLS